jgi:hypothetical protein
MATASLETHEILVTGYGPRVPSPAWAREFRSYVLDEHELEALRVLPPLTVVRAGIPAAFLAHRRFIDLLVRKQQGTGPAAILLLEFRSAPGSIDEAARIVEAFPESSRLELAFGPEHARSAVIEAFAKLLALSRLTTWDTLRPDTLGRARRVVAATSDLREASGRLSAERIAEAFALPVAGLAEILGRKRQTVAKTPDAESLQAPLLAFERIVRLRSVLSPEDFRKWLRMPNAELDGAAPLDWVRGGRAAAVADLAEDMLSGTAT